MLALGRGKLEGLLEVVVWARGPIAKVRSPTEKVDLALGKNVYRLDSRFWRFWLHVCTVSFGVTLCK